MKDERIIEEMAKVEFGSELRSIRFDDWEGEWEVVSKKGISQERSYFRDHNTTQYVIDDFDDGCVSDYRAELWRICNECMIDIVKATPRQKCEAILKALGKWEEG